MIIEYQKLKTGIEQFEAKREQLRTDREDAATAAQVVRQQYYDAVKLAVTNPSKTGEVAAIRVNLDIAEEGLRQAEEALAGYPAKPKGAESAYSGIRSAIISAKTDGTLFADFQPLLDTLAKLRRNYLENLKLLLLEKDQLDKAISKMQADARAAQEKYSGPVNVGINPPVTLSVSDFARWIWVENDYRNAFFEVEQSLRKPEKPPVSRNIIGQKVPQQNSIGQHERPIDNIFSTKTSV